MFLLLLFIIQHDISFYYEFNDILLERERERDYFIIIRYILLLY